MSTSIDDLLLRMRALEEELQAEFTRKREETAFVVEHAWVLPALLRVRRRPGLPRRTGTAAPALR
jgi:hypothetical protein